MEYGPQLWTAQKQLRALKMIQNIGIAILNPQVYENYRSALSTMKTRFWFLTVFSRATHTEESLS